MPKNGISKVGLFTNGLSKSRSIFAAIAFIKIDVDKCFEIPIIYV